MGRRAATALTARQVLTTTKQGYLADGMQPGLNLQVTPGRHGLSRSWVFRYTSPTTQKRREMGLGSVDARSLADAREIVSNLRLQVLNGSDPKDARDVDRREQQLERAKLLTFKEAASQCIAAKEHEWRNAKHEAQWSSSLETYAHPAIGSCLVSEITTEDVLRLLEPIWTKKTETATRVRQRIETVMDWCKARKLVSGDNPASLKGGLGILLPKASKVAKVQHHAALPYTDIHTFVQALRNKKGVSPRALEFLVLTAARSGEVLGAKRNEFDLTANIWTIPADRMKAGKEHRIPLCTRAREIVDVMFAAGTCDFVFPGPTGESGLSSAALLAVMKGMPEFASYVPHGMRSTFRDWGSETTNYSNEVLELALAHTIKNQAEAAYRRGDQLAKRAKLMQLWQQYVETPKSVDVVVPLSKARAS
ncbi:MAG: Prophage integrase [Pseudomonadota bacterium]